MTLDKRIPAVYVEIEDRSLAGTTLEAGRAGYVVILSDRGPHNKVVQLNSRRDLYDIFGHPDFMKYGQGHYLADKFLTYSSRLYVVRPCLLEKVTDSTDVLGLMSISNVNIMMNDATNDEGITELDIDFVFENGSNIVRALDSTSIVDITVGSWIYPTSVLTNIAGVMRQVIDVSINETDGVYELTLDSIYTGLDLPVARLNIYEPLQIESRKNLRDPSTLDSQSESILWHFHAIGAGLFYNNIFIKGVRNIELERMYTTENGKPMFPNMFMDISIYRRNDDNTMSLIEGPWPVSLVDRLPGGQIIRDVFSGLQLYLPVVVNQKSSILRCVDCKGSHRLMTTSVSEVISYPNEYDSNNRLAVLSIFSQGTVLGFNTLGKSGFYLKSGGNGTGNSSLFTDSGMLNFVGNEDYEALVAQSYNGSLKSVDGSVELIVQEVYPWYIFDYVMAGGYNAMIQNAARQLCDIRNDCLLLADLGYSTSADQDLEKRQPTAGSDPNNVDYSWNTWNAALYTPFREISDPNTGKKFMITPVYHAIENHLLVDSKYWIAEPVAGVEKGAIQEPIDLAYRANVTKLGDLLDAEINPTIVEPDGIYFLTQFSTWKRLSVLKRLHVVKFVHYLKKRIPSLLKDILQRKATVYWINQCNLRINGLMNLFLETNSSERYVAIKSYSAVVNFDDVRSEINIALTITPIRAIERIHVNIIVT